MASIKDKLAGQTAATPHKIVETDHENIRLSRDEFVLKYRKKAEIEAKLELEKKRLEEEAENEMKKLAEEGMKDNAPKVSNEEV